MARIAVADPSTSAGNSGQKKPPPLSAQIRKCVPNRIAVSEPRIATARWPAGWSGSAQRSAACSANAAAKAVHTQPGQNASAPVVSQISVTTNPRTAETAAWSASHGLPASAGIGRERGRGGHGTPMIPGARARPPDAPARGRPAG